MNITQCIKKEVEKIEFQLYTKLEYKPEIRICWDGKKTHTAKERKKNCEKWQKFRMSNNFSRRP